MAGWHSKDLGDSKLRAEKGWPHVKRRSGIAGYELRIAC
jgi:hypothetical protein